MKRKCLFTMLLLLIAVVLQAQQLTFSQGDFDFEVLENDFTAVQVKALDGTLKGNVVIPDNVTYKGVTYTVAEIQDMGDNPDVLSIRIPKTVYSYGGLSNLRGLLNFYVDEENPNYQSIDGVLVVKRGMKLVEFPLGRTGEYEVPNGIEQINTYFPSGITKLRIPSTVKSVSSYIGNYITEFEVADDNATFSSVNGALCSKDGKTLIAYPIAGKSMAIMPIDIDSIGTYALGQKVNVIINSENPPSIGYSSSYYGYNTYIRGIYVRSENLSNYQNDARYSKYNIFGYDVIKDSLIYAKTANGEATLIGSYSESANIEVSQTIADETNTYSVTGIGRRAFLENEQINKVNFPKTLKTIGDSAFYNTNIRELKLPASLATIGKHAFWYCYNIQNIYAECAPVDISAGCFYYYRTLYVPSEYEEQYKTSVGWSNFTIVSNDIIYDDFVLKKLTDKTLSVTQYIGSKKEVVIPDVITIDNKDYKVTSIGASSFSGKSLTSVILPQWIEEIGESAFRGNHLSSVDFPNTLKTIGAYAFYGCNLTSITLPTSLEIIGTSAFRGNNSAVVVFENETPCTLGSSPFVTGSYLKILVPSSSIDKYKTATGWQSYGNNIYGVDAIIDGFAYKKSSDDTVELSCCLKSFDANEYNSITIPETVSIDNSNYIVTTIGESAFYSTYNLNELIIPEKIDSIGSRAFNSNVIIRLGNPIPPQANNQTFYSYPQKVIVPIAALDAYKTAPYWKNIDFLIMAYDLLVDGVAYLKLDDTRAAVSGVLTLPENGVLNIPDKITYDNNEYTVSVIGANAFSISGDCRLLTLPQTIDSIASNAYCHYFSLVYLKTTTPPRLGDTNYNDIYVPNSALDAYYNNKQWVSSDWYKSYIHGTDGIIDNDSVIYNINTSNLSAELCLWMKASTNKIEVPQTVTLNGNTYSITALGRDAFYRFNNVSTFIIPESVSTIDNYALPRSSNMTVIAKALVPPTIGYQNTYTPNQQTLYVKSAAYESYSMADVWKEFGNIVPIDDGDDQFYYAKAGNGKAIVTGVIDNTKSDYEIPESIVIEGEVFTVTYIGEKLFMNNRKVQKVKLPNTIEEIGEKAFYGSSLQQITIPASVEKIGERAFGVNWNTYSYSSLEKIQVRTGNENFMDRNERLLLSKDGKSLLQTASDATFFSRSWDWNYVLKETNYLDEVERVENGAFDGCRSSIIKLPSSLADVDASMLMHMSNLDEINVDTLNPKLCSIDGVLFSKDTTTVVYFPYDKGSYYDYQNYELPENVKTIGKFAFYNSRFESLTLSDSLEVIADSAFYSQYSYYYPRTLILTNDKIAVASKTAFTDNMYWNTILYVPMGTQSDYVYTNPWYNFRNVNSARLSEEDFLLLKEFYEEMGNGEGWYRKWEFGETADETRITRGLRMVDDHVYSIDLSNNGLRGGLSDKLFKLPYLQILNLSNNSLSCPIDSVLNEENINNDVLRELNISNNHFTGNIGVVGSILSSLNTLNASNNRLTKVSPMLPSVISDLNLNYQSMDTIDYKSLYSADFDNVEAIPYSLLFYDHFNRRYNSNRSFTLRNTDDNYWYMNLDYNYGTPMAKEGYSDYRLYKRPVNDILRLSDNSGYGHSAYVAMMFDPGDVNFDTSVNVSDLQQTVNYAVSEEAEQLFNFTAADIQADDWVNVQDVVSLVNILLAQQIDTNIGASPRRRVAKAEDAEAQLYWRDNQLILKTECDVAAIDIAIENADDVKWLLNDFDYDYSVSKKDNYVRVIHYSMAGKEIKAGETVVAEVTGSDLHILKADLVKKNGQPVKATATGAATGISEVSGHDTNIKIYADASGMKLKTNQSLSNVKWAVYTIGGTLLGSGVSNLTAGLNSLECNLTGENQVVISLSNENMNVTKKISVTK